jgi:hypothetical protein
MKRPILFNKYLSSITRPVPSINDFVIRAFSATSVQLYNGTNPGDNSDENYNTEKHYSNVDIDKLQIMLDNKQKSGIYCLINKKKCKKKYVGSSINLRIIFSPYLNINHLIRHSYMPICLALTKYGYSNFSLKILEYCKPSGLLKQKKINTIFLY